jgi:hypothetical protein
MIFSLAAWNMLTFNLGSQRRKADCIRKYKEILSCYGSRGKFQQMKMNACNQRICFFFSSFPFPLFCLGATALDSCVERTGRANFRAPIGIFGSVENGNLSRFQSAARGSWLLNTNPKKGMTKRQASSQPKSSRMLNLGRMIDKGHVLYHALSHTLSLFQANGRRWFCHTR